MASRTLLACALAACALPASARRSRGGDAPLWEGLGVPHRPRSLGDYGNTGVWPLPANAVGVGSTKINPRAFAFVVSPPNDAYLLEVTRRYRDWIFYHPNGTFSGGASLATVGVVVTDPSVRQITSTTDESYSIQFSGDLTAATITATTIFGARHGLETFSQLTGADRLTGAYSVTCLNINEAPRFPHRGLLIDSARHWLPPNVLLSVMDAMSFNKMNALQVGFGIDWSWTVEVAAFPNISETTTYGPKGTHVYNRSTVAWLVQEANYRGVRIIPYFELVGHDALGGSQPQLMWCNGKNGTGLPHPLHAETWAFFDTLFVDLKQIFPDDQFNFGGDEVDISCWMQDPEINAWMVTNGYPAGDWDYIVSLYYMNMIKSMAKAGFKPIMFADAFGTLNGSHTDLTGTGIVFDDWDTGSPGSLANVIQAPGVQAIVSSYCFLAPTQGCPDNLPDGGTPNWFTNINCEIQNKTLFPPAAWPYLDRIIGGHPSRWGEQTDGTNIFQFTWPAVMGAAEKLWTPAALTNGSFYGSRQEVFADHRCVLIRRGIPVAPTSAYSWSCPYEFELPYPPLTPSHPATNGHSSWGPPVEADGGNSDSGDAQALQQRVKDLEAQLAAAQAALREAQVQA